MRPLVNIDSDVSLLHVQKMEQENFRNKENKKACGPVSAKTSESKWNVETLA